MSKNRIAGIALFAVGLFLLGFAYNATQAPAEELSNTITGGYSDDTMWMFALGIGAVFGGGLLAVFGARR